MLSFFFDFSVLLCHFWSHGGGEGGGGGAPKLTLPVLEIVSELQTEFGVLSSKADGEGSLQFQIYCCYSVCLN
jgi:hypothetical protein